MRKLIYLEIKNRILSIQNAEEEPLFKHFDLWNHQTENQENSEQEISLQTPAVFLEFMPIKWQMRGSGVQETDLTVRLHIITEYANEQASECFETVDYITTVMHNSAAPGNGRWQRSKSISDHKHKHYIDNIEEYVCYLQEIPTSSDMRQVELYPSVKK